MPKGYTGAFGSEHLSCLASHINQHPRAPEYPGGSKKVIYQCVVDSHDASMKHRRGVMPRNAGKWLAFLSTFHHYDNSSV